MRGYKYVKFSKRTAIINPSMINDAYTKLIKEYKDKIRPLDEVRFTINARSARHISEVTTESFKETKMKFELKCDDVVELYKKALNNNNELIMLKAELKNIKEEHSKFVRRFNSADY